MTTATEETIISLFSQRIKSHGSSPALHVPAPGGFEMRTWQQLADKVYRLAGLFVRLGVEPGDRILQISENREEWIVCDLAIQCVRGVHVPVHSSLTGPQIAWQIVDSGARIVCFSTEEQANKLVEVAEHLPDALRFISYDAETAAIGRCSVEPLSRATASVSPAEGKVAEQRAVRETAPDDLSTILYTSGTTGEPKGVMLCQRNLVTNATAALQVFEQARDDVRLNFLPLSHIFARTCDLYTWIVSGAELALARSRETVIADCAAVRPTLLNGVPYFFEKVMRILQDHGQADVPGALQHLFGGRLRFCCSGGAALPDHVFDFFHERGLMILQGYGLTETSPVITASAPRSCRRGTVGPAIPGVEIRIAADGEILTRGPHVMLGYWRNSEATAEVIRDGWLYTGDLGEIDDAGLLKITGRKKEILVTSGGKNVAPVLIESLLTADPLILQALVVGDGRSYVSALIVPDPDVLDGVLQERKIQTAAGDQRLQDPQVVALFEEAIHRRLACVSPYERVRKFCLLPRRFSIEYGELTPKLSLRRREIEKNFAAEITRMYG
ncbi:MAG TPA: AMP-dependent synthetase/ligase, partial [Burkholderiales bacterium]|nr:AMP-dependent synthetase/ligase [Burkholderiales bacterium]